MLIEITEPQKDERFHELSKDDFQIRTLDFVSPIHDSMVIIWKSTNEKIEDKLEELKSRERSIESFKQGAGEMHQVYPWKHVPRSI